MNIILDKASQVFAVQTNWLAAAQQTSTAKFAAFFQKLKKTVCALKVNESKVTFKNTFIDNIFAIKSWKASEKDKTTIFRD